MYRTCFAFFLFLRLTDLGTRFVSRSRDEVETRVTSETEALRLDISNLGKKLHYLETTHKNSRDHIDQILRSRG